MRPNFVELWGFHQILPLRRHQTGRFPGLKQRSPRNALHPWPSTRTAIIHRPCLDSKVLALLSLFFLRRCRGISEVYGSTDDRI